MNLKTPVFNFNFLDKIRHSEKTETCEKHGIYRPIEFNGRKTKCPACIEEKRKEEDARRENERYEEDLKRRLKAINIPKRFLNRVTGLLDDYDTGKIEQKAAWRTAFDYAKNWNNVYRTGQSLLFVGRPGTGKTHLALGIAQEVVHKGANARYISLLEMIETIKDSWRRHGEAEYHIDQFSTVELLIIDEISSAYNTANEHIQFFRVVNKRYENMLPTILISNATLEETKAIIGEAAWDRLKEGGGSVVTFNWDSYRK